MPSHHQAFHRRIAPSLTAMTLALSGAMAIGMAVPAMAQEGEASQPQGQAVITPESQPGWRWSFQTGMAHQFEADIDGGGDVTTTRYSLGATGGGPINDRLDLNIKLGYERNDYRFSSVTRMGNDPWEGVNVLAVQATLAYHLDDQWTIHGGPILSLAAEDAADWSRSVAGGGAVGVGYRVNDKLHLGAGVAVTSRLEDSVAVFPIIQFHWQICDDLALRSSTFDLGVQGGAGVELAWQAHPTLELAAGAQYQNRRFRLDRRDIAPDGVGEESACPVYIKASWQPNRQISLTGVAGALLGGRLELEDEDGHRLTRRHVDPAFFLGGRVALRF